MKKTIILILSFLLLLIPASAQKKKKQATGKEPLFGKALATYPIKPKSSKSLKTILINFSSLNKKFKNLKLKTEN